MLDGLGSQAYTSMLDGLGSQAYNSMLDGLGSQAYNSMLDGLGSHAYASERHRVHRRDLPREAGSADLRSMSELDSAQRSTVVWRLDSASGQTVALTSEREMSRRFVQQLEFACELESARAGPGSSKADEIMITHEARRG
eukprot:850776-Rhodomonas_salina.2